MRRSNGTIAKVPQVLLQGYMMYPTIDVSNLRLQLAKLQTQFEEHNQACIAREKYEAYRRAKLHRIVGDLMASLRQV